MKNFTFSCLLSWLLALEYRQSNGVVREGVSLLSCLVPWSLLSTKPWFQSQCVLTCSGNVSLHPHYPSSELFYSPKPKWRQKMASLLQGKLSLRTCSLPFADNNQLLKNTNDYTKLFTLSAGHLQDLCFCTANQEGRPFEPNNWIKRKSFCLLEHFPSVNSSTTADWQDSQMQLRTGNGKRRGARLRSGARFLAPNGKSGFSPTSCNVLRLQNIPW